VSYGLLRAQIPGPAGSEFQVNTRTTGTQRSPSVGMDADGDFVVVWQSFGEDAAATWGAFGRRFNSAGTPLATPFQVNSFTASHQYYPHVALDADGDFVVVWTSYLQDGFYGGVFGRLFSSSSAPLGGPVVPEV
jgi:hypothetical protein